MPIMGIMRPDAHHGHEASSPHPSGDLKNPSGAFDSSCEIRWGVLSPKRGNFRSRLVKPGHRSGPNQWSARDLGEKKKEEKN